jgi:hypothetical protein
MARTSFTLVMLAIAGAMALVLGVVGIHGVISYAVSQRTREIGIRLALGAQQGELKSMFVRHGLMLACVGVTLGLGAAMGLTRLMRSLRCSPTKACPERSSFDRLRTSGPRADATYKRICPPFACVTTPSCVGSGFSRIAPRTCEKPACYRLQAPGGSFENAPFSYARDDVTTLERGGPIPVAQVKNNQRNRTSQSTRQTESVLVQVPISSTASDVI